MARPCKRGSHEGLREAAEVVVGRRSGWAGPALWRFSSVSPPMLHLHVGMKQRGWQVVLRVILPDPGLFPAVNHCTASR
ncbi:hypothetical protein EYF80_027502 [Liparis tanakae]|uniref:Uncharacterized protein n=1 Tax=Liparis tanakae TaxID=230148 RepID=A0A4Z2H8M1_9TELE|nr:hypothetical protein EYF80_027502 [Liparis tanakae]